MNDMSVKWGFCFRVGTKWDGGMTREGEEGAE
jgi:hypothetical protein